MEKERSFKGCCRSGATLTSNKKCAFVLRQVSPDLQKARGVGFTLIELLVVVLIIGILAAVAVPQYQAAVDRARYTQAMAVVDAAAKADRVYFMANGNFAQSFYDLDIDLPTPSSVDATGGWFYYPWGYCYFSNADRSSINCQVYMGGGRAYYSVNITGNTRQCFATKETPRANKVCQHVTGKKGSPGDTYTWYTF